VIGGETIYAGHRWPPPGAAWTGDVSKRAGYEAPAAAGVFRKGIWGLPFFSDIVLADFVDYEPPLVPPVVNPPPDYIWKDALDTAVGSPDSVAQVLLAAATNVNQELDELVTLIPYRAGVLNEALAQRDNILNYFRGLLTFTRGSHPATFYLCAAALRVGAFQSNYFKAKFNRSRPAQLSAAIIPPIETPAHASYPSGHSTQSRLLALLLETIVPALTLDRNGALVPEAERPARLMAQRIARNREVFGLHYPSDSRIGQRLADRSFPILMQCQSVIDLFDIAQAEW
jgi:hypothetical protein